MRLVTLLRCSHPEPVAAVTLLVTVLAIAGGRGPGAIWVAAAVLAGQLFVGWTNDYLDRDRDAAAGRSDKPIAAGQIGPGAVRRAAAVALPLAALLSLASGLPATLVHVVAIGAATVYNLWLKFTVLSPLPYAIAFGLVPAFVTFGLAHSHAPPLWAVTAGALIGAGAHFAQVLPDIDADREMGVLGLPQRMGRLNSAVAAATLLAAAALAVGLGPGQSLDGAKWAILILGVVLAAAVMLLALTGRPRRAFHATIATAAVVVAGFVLSGSALA